MLVSWLHRDAGVPKDVIEAHAAYEQSPASLSWRAGMAGHGHGSEAESFVHGLSATHAHLLPLDAHCVGYSVPGGGT